MRIQFECVCGHEIADSTRNSSDSVNTPLECDECGSVYAATITLIHEATEY